MDEEIKQAWRWLDPDHAILTSSVRCICEAFIESEWQRRRAEFKLWHQSCGVKLNNQRIMCDDPHHDFGDSDWRAELIQEIEE